RHTHNLSPPTRSYAQEWVALRADTHTQPVRTYSLRRPRWQMVPSAPASRSCNCPSLTGAAGQDTAPLVGAVGEADAGIVTAALAVVLAVGVLAAEGFQVVQSLSSRRRAKEKVTTQLQFA